MRRTAIALFVFTLATACATTQPQSVSALSDRLFCGRSIPAGGEVTDEDVAKFLAEVVAPRFPDGFSIFPGFGHWQGGNERMFVIEVIHPLDPSADRRMTEIAEEYRKRFGQQAVLRVILPARMSLIEAPPPPRASD